MRQLIFYDDQRRPSSQQKEAIIDFLYEQLGQFGDPKEAILKAVDYALQEYPSDGGFVLQYLEDERTIGVVVINRTGMEGYIPENILVYIAAHEDMRGKGIGRKMMQLVLEKTQGSIALHVEPDNPARHLYERMGFTNKYLEMRYQKVVD